MLLWLRVAVGVILTVSFSVPLVIIASNGSLRREPMTLLVINMTLIDLVYAALFLGSALADVVFAVEGVPPPLCAVLQYALFGCAIAWKMATLCLALDQFIAVTHSLRYNAILAVWVYRLVALSWGCVPLVGLFGFICYRLDLETAVEFDRRVLGVERHLGAQCRWELNAHLFMVSAEVALLLLSLTSGVLFIYAAVQGARHEWRLHPSNRLFLRFKSFQRIVKVLLIVVTIDVAAAGARVGSRWTGPTGAAALIQLMRVLCMVAEAWTYGLTMPAVRSALMAFFGCRGGRVAGLPDPEVQRPTDPNADWPERDITRSSRF